MSWGAFEYDGVACDLSHLDPFTINVSPKAPGSPTWKVLVSFGHHTFTREIRPGDKPEHEFIVGNDPRCFCFAERYPLSKQLPAIVAANAGGKAYFTQGRNFMFVKTMPGLPNGPYAIFFTVRRAERSDRVDAIMFIDSAYPKPALPPTNQLKAITMPTIVSKAVGQGFVTGRRKKRRHKRK